MSDQDAFQQAGEPKTPEVTQPPVEPAVPQNQPQDAFADKLASIKNEDGTPKYADVSQALESIPHAQSHIQTIESENATLKVELAKAEAAKELLEKAGNTGQQPTGLTAEEVAEITQKTLAQQTETSRKEGNVQAVNAKFSELYGDKASAEMKKVADDAGMSVAEVRTLAEKSPLAVYRLAGLSSQPKAPVPKTPGAGVGDNFQPPEQKNVQPKSVMSGASTAEMVEGWHAAGEIIKQQ